MFIESDITLMKDRLGWSEHENLLYVNKINDDNKKKDSGLTLNGFHKLVTLENIFNSQPITDISNEQFNNYLTEMLDNVVREVFIDVFVTDFRADKKYTGTISEMISTGVFDTCIGYCHAVKVLELYVSSVRSNRIESISKANYAFLMGELKGRTTKSGVLVAKGLLEYCKDHRESIKKKLYGFSGVVIYDATNEW